MFWALDVMSGRGAELRRIDLGFADPLFANWALSSDGTDVALVNFDGRVRIVDLESEDVETLEVAGWTALEHIDWAADREGVFVVGFSVNGPRLNNMALLRVDLDGRVRVLRQQVNQWHVFPAAAPDGSRLAFAMMILDSNAWMVENF